MKTASQPKLRALALVPLLLMMAGGSALAQGETPKKPVFRNAATHEELAETARQIAEKEAKEALRPVRPPTKEEVEKNKPTEPTSLAAVSDILYSNGLATMVPKRAILHVPKALAERIGMRDGARIVSYQEFAAQNRSWLTSTPVSRVQAEGNKPLSEAVIKSFEKETRVVVATFQEGPIPVLPVKVPEAPTASTP